MYCTLIIYSDLAIVTNHAHSGQAHIFQLWPGREAIINLNSYYKLTCALCKRLKATAAGSTIE